MKIYIDITQLEKQRVNTGIQRVVKEFLENEVISKPNVFVILLYDKTLKKMQTVPIKDLKLFLNDLENFQFKNRKTIEIEKLKPSNNTIFFDIDSAWNAPYKRDKLYPKLKKNGFLIYNFIYDLIPIVVPQYVQEKVVQNYQRFIQTVYKYSDFTFCISKATQNDFLSYKNQLKIKRKISTKVVYLGSDFKKYNTSVEDEFLKDILNKKYILFVGTVEPRKSQEIAFKAFETLSKKYDDLNLVFIGMKGWNQEEFFDTLENHPLLNEKFFWLKGIDDSTLYHFYKNAHIVTYLSKYEGFGLPVIESLQHGKITITSNNTSMPEAGLEFADYISNNEEELVKLISAYEDDEDKFKLRQKLISNNFKALSWKEFSQKVYKTLEKNKKKRSVLKWLKSWIKNLIKLNNTNYRLQKLENKIKELTLENTTLKEKEKLSKYLDKYYLDFENKFRGSRNYILNQYKEYLKFIENHTINTSLDIGCGRAEWVQLLQEKNIDAHGIDLNNSMLNIGKKSNVKNLKCSDAFEYLKATESNSFDLITAFHIIEHIPYEKLITLLMEIKRVAKNNSLVLLETPNPANLLVASNNFYKDPTHLNPLPSDVVKFLLEHLGFINVRIEFLHPMNEDQRINEDSKTAHVLNDLLYKEQDYLLIAQVRK